jgi:hypothetical protein
MAQIDLKECTIKLFDGTLGTVTLDSTPADSDLVLTAKSKHIGSDKISVEMLDPSTASGPLGVAVSGRKITVTLGTSSASAIDSTAAEVKTAIEGNTTANALVSVALETAGTGVVEAQVEASLDGQQSLTVKVGEGNLTYSEHRAVEFTRDRGVLDSVRLADEEPMDISMDIMWEWISSVASSGTPTMEDALKQINEASAWVTTADDTCQPFCVDIEFHNAPQCTGIEDEILMFEEYYYETLDHDPREGTISTSGRCNRKVATATRILAADIG